MPPLKISFNNRVDWRPVGLPGSKSIAARALICRYVAGLDTKLLNLPDCDDTCELAAALERLRGAEAGKPMALNAGNGGTSLRFLLALVASLPGVDIELDCGDSLRHRPLSPLVDALRSIGAEIEYLREEGYPPLRIHGRRLRGGNVKVSSSASSQFVSALMLASPLWETPMTLESPELVSKPYIEMTRRVMERFANRPTVFEVEGDWSAAAFFYELALAVPGRVLEIDNLTPPEVSLQGDCAACGIFGFLGVNTEWRDGHAFLQTDVMALEGLRKSGYIADFDMNAVPDLVPPLSAALCMAGIPFNLTEIGHLKHKESDRLLALSTELPKAGYAVREGADGEASPGRPDGRGCDSLIWNGRLCPVAGDEVFESWGDHRIAMVLSLLAARKGYVALRGAESVSKSFPGFFETLERVGFTIGD